MFLKIEFTKNTFQNAGGGFPFQIKFIDKFPDESKIK